MQHLGRWRRSGRVLVGFGPGEVSARHGEFAAALDSGGYYGYCLLSLHILVLHFGSADKVACSVVCASSMTSMTVDM